MLFTQTHRAYELKKNELTRSRVISHARRGRGKRRNLALRPAGDGYGRAMRTIEPDESKQNKNRSRADGYRLEKSDEELRKIHCRIMRPSGPGIDITHRLEQQCHSCSVSIATSRPEGPEPKRRCARMTFVTLSAGYGGPTIGVGYEFPRSPLAESRISREQSETHSLGN